MPRKAREGGEFLIVPCSDYRERIVAECVERAAGADGTVLNGLELYMDGVEVFAFIR